MNEVTCAFCDKDMREMFSVDNPEATHVCAECIEAGVMDDAM